MINIDIIWNALPTRRNILRRLPVALTYKTHKWARLASTDQAQGRPMTRTWLHTQFAQAGWAFKTSMPWTRERLTRHLRSRSCINRGKRPKKSDERLELTLYVLITRNERGGSGKKCCKYRNEKKGPVKSIANTGMNTNCTKLVQFVFIKNEAKSLVRPLDVIKLQTGSLLPGMKVT